MSSEKKNRIYITSAIPYVNASPHIGHALEYIQADTIARHFRAKGNEVLLLCGSDDNALKNVQAATEAGISVKDFISRNAKKFEELAGLLHVEFCVFQNGSDIEHHFPSSQKFWKLCADAGDIYKKSYEGLYCVGCESFYASDELNKNGECFEHPGKKLETVSEENYFFRLSKYQEALIEFLSSNTLKIIPETRKNEVLSFLKEPLHDISISRSNERAKNWGVPVPGDDTQKIYVWFDALNIYQSGIGFGWNDEEYQKWWPAHLHVIGKGIIRFHAVYWPAFLMSAKLELPRSLFVHGYITNDGQKMSKTLGNVVDPVALVEEFGAEPIRYYVLREIPAHGDGDFSRARLIERYNGDLANGLGNLVSRVAALGEKISPLQFDFSRDIEKEIDAASDETFKKYEAYMEDFRLNEALGAVWELISFADRYINDKKPWVLKEGPEFARTIKNAGYLISTITNLVEPFLPETAEKIRDQIRFEDSRLIIKKGAGLFPRLL